ncbi:hypothetical protein QBC41DRAFT_307795 [Cercophora samala]|uniref:Uncharacterized protein n=1 Tax=Cercophora samala TaxID=330535 RepID=A0AA39YXK9_9PEZI|nr:hypothetical protein QBC41DRAFT_307795 [Cercophora samala]
MFTIVISMHVAFNSAIECRGADAPNDGTEIQHIAEVKDVAALKAVAEPKGITQVKDLSPQGDLARVRDPDQTHTTTENAPKGLTAAKSSYEAPVTSADTKTNKTMSSKEPKHTKHAGDVKNVKSKTKAWNTRHSKTSRKARTTPRPIIYTNGTTPYRVENPMPEGALGLAASRWAKKDSSGSPIQSPVLCLRGIQAWPALGGLRFSANISPDIECAQS